MDDVENSGDFLLVVLNVDFLSADSIAEYIRTYGFPFPLPHDGFFHSYPFEQISRLFMRFARTVWILQEIVGKVQPDARQLLRHTLSLVFAPGVKVSQSGSLEECLLYPAAQLWFHGRGGAEPVSEGFDEDGSPLFFYRFFDTIQGKEICERADFLHHFPHYRDHTEDEVQADLEDRVHAFYYEMPPQDELGRLMADLMYALCRKEKVRLIRSTKDPMPHLPEGYIVNPYLPRYQEVIIRIARLTLKAEIEYVLSKVQPCFDPDTCGPCWEMPTLWTALYYSLLDFSDRKIKYQSCIGCGKVFNLKRGNSQKRYCTSQCQNSRARIKNEAEKHGGGLFCVKVE